ncbi:unnamed protein product, partial [Mesorhabditis belari]|uniref:RING-type domain-containing protein n=1 Tax=Mesorhabditis belari TaxID=2138241 RepID=A0AAF3EDR0_9BILA
MSHLSVVMSYEKSAGLSMMLSPLRGSTRHDVIGFNTGLMSKSNDTNNVRVFESLKCWNCRETVTGEMGADGKVQGFHQTSCSTFICTPCHALSPRDRKRMHLCIEKYCIVASPNVNAIWLSILLSDTVRLSPDKNGYILAKAFTTPKCPTCDEGFSVAIPKRHPFVLTKCGHTICRGCSERLHPQYPQVLCPGCKTASNKWDCRRDQILFELLNDVEADKEVKSIRVHSFDSLKCWSCAQPALGNCKLGANGELQGVYQMKCVTAFLCGRCVASDPRRRQRMHVCGETDCASIRLSPYSIWVKLVVDGFVKMSSDCSGYVIEKPFPQIECPICAETFSTSPSAREPIDLPCGHTVCQGCSGKLLINETQVRCGNCGTATHRDQNRKNRILIAFLNELNSVLNNPQQKEKCEKCGVEHRPNKSVHCEECRMTLCAMCFLMEHREHEFTRLDGIAIAYQINAYSKAVPILQQEVDTSIQLFENLVVEKRGEWPDCQVFGNRFEEISEEYIPHLRTYGTKLKQLCDEAAGKDIES